jgi:hypothetical protein
VPDLPPETPPAVIGAAGLPPEVQEQLFGVLRAALDASLVPLLDKQMELEERLERLIQAERAAASARALPAARAVSLAPTIDVTVPSPSISAKPLVTSTSYGLVMESPAGMSRPPASLDLSNVGPIDVPDFGSNRRIGRFLVGLLFAGVAAAIIATILSYS